MTHINDSNASTNLKKIATGIEGLDLIAGGGLPFGRSTLLSGTAGSAKPSLPPSSWPKASGRISPASLSPLKTRPTTSQKM